MRNVALVLSGGTGDRMGGGTPKQYRTVAGKPVLVHTLERLERCSAIDGVFVIASPQWTDRILEWKEAFGLEKLLGAAPAGANRQLSIRNGLLAARRFMDGDEGAGVMIQDAVRPLTGVRLLEDLMENLREAACVMPVLPVTDTTYTSEDGRWVSGLLERSALYAGQAPEAFRYWPYLALYRDTPEAELSSMSGSCQLPYQASWNVKMIPGERENIKITYAADLKICELLLHGQEESL